MVIMLYAVDRGIGVRFEEGKKVFLMLQSIHTVS
jgi:hypothetical protein